MSNQLQITGAAKVRGLEGVLTGTSGIVGALGINVANGIPKLDSNGKILVSQLPSSVMEYKGTWNAATNTPTLANGTGDTGDVYLCNVAGTTNFGAGPITFAVGDQVIYSGSIWQKASGATGTVTSVAMTVPSGLTVTGSPITTSGTLAVSLASGYTIPTTSFLSGLVPYTGATQTVDLGSYDLNARGIKINGTGGLGHADFKHQSGTPTGSASSSTLYADTNGNIAWLNDHSYTMTLAANANTADRTYTFPDANGTIALTSNLTSYVPYSGATTNVNLGSYGLSGNGDFVMGSVKSAGIFAESVAGAAGYLYLKGDSSFGLLSGYNSIFANGFKYGFEAYGGSSLNSKRAYLDFGSLTNNTTRTYTFPNASGTIALTSDIPSLSGYVPYTGATSQVDLGSNNLYGKSLNVWGDGTNGGGLNLKQYTSQSFLPGYGYTAVYTDSSYGFGIWFLNSASTGRQINFNASLLANNTGQTYYLPAATGTIALTSDIPSLANYVTTNTNQTISGIKTFSNEQLFGNGITLTGGYITYTSGSFNLTLNTNLLTANRNVFLQDKAGTIALTSDLTGGTVTSVGLSSATSGVTIGSSPITTSGTITLAIATASGSQQGLLSSTDWTTFNNKQNALTNPVTGTGTSSYHAKFTGTSTIGNSMLTDDGTTLQSIGATRSNLYLKAASSSYYGQLAFTNGSNGSFGGISYNNSGQYMQFETNSSEWMRLTSDGKLGIGTTSPSAKLEVTADGIDNHIGISGSITSNIGYLSYISNNSPNRLLAIGGIDGIQFKTGAYNSATERMRITSSGNVGIGTSSPPTILNVIKDATGSYNASTYAGAAFMTSRTTANGENIALRHTGSANNGISGTNYAGQIVSDGNNVLEIYTTATGPLVLGTNSTERMRITGGGLVGIGTSAFGTALMSLKSSTTASRWNFGPNTYSSADIFRVENQDTTGVYLTSGNTSWTANSDERLKDITGNIENAIDALKTLRTVKFTWKKDKSNKINLGLIAQDVIKVFPEVVDINEDEDKTLGVKYSELVPVLIAAIQELSAKLTALENKIN